VYSTLRGDLAVLSEQPFLFLFLARTVSLFGSALTLGALPFAVLGMHGGSATVLGLVLGARSLAQVALLLLGGVLADRLPKSRSRLMASSDVLAFASQGLAAALFITGAAKPAEIIMLSAASGAASALFGPAAKGLVPQLVDGPRLQSANVVLRLSYNTTGVSAPRWAGSSSLRSARAGRCLPMRSRSRCRRSCWRGSGYGIRCLAGQCPPAARPSAPIRPAGGASSPPAPGCAW